MPSPSLTSHRDIIVIGASAGGLAALVDLVRELPEDFPAAIFVVIHTSPDNPGVLPQILGRAAKLPAAFARDGEPIVRGRIYVAPPDHHLLLKQRTVRVSRGPKENGFRPAVDPLFRTAALSQGARTIGIVLSGGLNDGTHGLAIITQRGGVALAQDPQEALIASMPLSAIQNVEVRRILRVAEMPAVLAELVREPISEDARAMPEHTDIAEAGDSLAVHPPQGQQAPYTCPECGGALWESNDFGTLLRFRCHVGHAYTAEILMSEQEVNLEEVLWSALRALEENAALCRRMAERTDRAGLLDLARRYDDDAAQGEQRAAVLRHVLQREAAISRSLRPIDSDALHTVDADPMPSEASGLK